MATTIPLTITLPKDLVAEVKSVVPKGALSEFLAEAAREKLATLTRKNAHKQLQELPPAYPEIRDESKYVGKLRASDGKRARRLRI